MVKNNLCFLKANTASSNFLFVHEPDIHLSVIRGAKKTEYIHI